ncbi:hypothetical protein DACRYDRAFT_107007 [Dacryopinax primogenitus]|uniref:Uncharacterized protein n=1 Tax=Dacryopinax primogenitus (strain DJM 731) TaxID=1858805 RepID=M5G2K9_DACPD|nr:uncharacterized protein DACRYDRAFT_107007 [Dacryopinax primogenitus]EJU02924.1 hypothetical protein DACRYDRAFT_107007 [Dacryopinax primogenitus]
MQRVIRCRVVQAMRAVQLVQAEHMQPTTRLASTHMSCRKVVIVTLACSPTVNHWAEIREGGQHSAKAHLGLIRDFLELDASSTDRLPSLIRLGDLEADGSPVFDPTLVERYLERLDRAKLSTLVAAHVTGGGMNRGTEFLSGKIHNDRLGLRNYHFMDGMIAYHTTYLKTRASSYAHGMNIRVYPERVTVLFLKWAAKHRSMRGTSSANCGTGFFRTDRFSDTLQLLTHLHAALKLNIHDYRQIVKLVLHRSLRSSSRPQSLNFFFAHLEATVDPSLFSNYGGPNADDGYYAKSIEDVHIIMRCELHVYNVELEQQASSPTSGSNLRISGFEDASDYLSNLVAAPFYVNGDGVPINDYLTADMARYATPYTHSAEIANIYARQVALYSTAFVPLFVLAGLVGAFTLLIFTLIFLMILISFGRSPNSFAVLAHGRLTELLFAVHAAFGGESDGREPDGMESFEQEGRGRLLLVSSTVEGFAICPFAPNVGNGNMRS